MKWKKYLLCLIYALSMPSMTLASESITLLTHTSPPYVSADGNKGIAIDIATLLFKDSNISYKVENYPLARALRLAELKPNFCVFPIQRTQEREAKYKWVSPILISNSAAFSLTKENSDLRVLADIQNKQLGVQRGSADEEYLNSLKRHFLIDSAGSELQNIQKLEKKRIDFWITDTLASAYYQARTGINLKQHFIFRTTLRALACHINTPDTLISKLSESLKKHYKLGDIHRIISSYTDKLKYTHSTFGHDNSINK